MPLATKLVVSGTEMSYTGISPSGRMSLIARQYVGAASTACSVAYAPLSNHDRHPMSRKYSETSRTCAKSKRRTVAFVRRRLLITDVVGCE